jgi:uncharacterized membrane protein YphA (DoxX/SURF4 family)
MKNKKNRSFIMKKALPWILSIFITFVFVQSLFFKFAGSEETVIIFNTIGNWMQGIALLSPISELFISYGGYLIGSVELVASILVLIPATRLWGAMVGIATMSGAIFFHLFTPLGVDRIVDAAGNTDGGILFIMACAVWLSCAALIFITKSKQD